MKLLRLLPWLPIAVAGAALNTACDGGPATGPTAPDADRARPVAALSDATGHAELPPPGPASAVQAVGELELPDGRVERAYRVRFVNGPRARYATAVELVGVPPGVEVLGARIDVGDLAPHEAVTPPGAVTLRHAASLRLHEADLQWRWHDGASADPHGGQRLLGAASDPAHDALRSVADRDRQRAATLAALLHDAATVGEVNAALQGAGLLIVEMRPGNFTLGLRTLTGGDRALLRAAQRLRASPAFARVDLRAAPPAATAGPAPGSLTWAAAAEVDAAADAACQD